MVSSWKGLVFLATLLVVSGCYTYVPVRPMDAMLDARVRVTVSPEQAARLAPVLRNVTPQVVGTLIDRDDQGVMLDVPLYGSSAAGSTQTVRSRIAISFSDLVSLERRELSRWRTAVAVGAALVGVGGSWAVVGGGSGGEDKPKTDIDNAVITWFSIPFAIFD